MNKHGQQKQSHKEKTGGCRRVAWVENEFKMWGKLTGTNFQLQNKWVKDEMYMCVVNTNVVSLYAIESGKKVQLFSYKY